MDTLPTEETDVPNFFFDKVSMDVSGIYGETPRGNMHILNSVDWLTNWPKAYAVCNKKI